MNNILTTDDIEILIDSLDCWESNIQKNSIMYNMVDFAINPPKNKEETNRRIEEERKRNKDEEKKRTEISIMLKAKLISMKNQLQKNDENYLNRLNKEFEA